MNWLFQVMRPLRRLLHTLSGWQYPADCFVSKAVSNYRRFPPQKPQQQQQNDILLFDFFKKDLTGELRPLAVTPQGPSPHSNLPVSEFHSEIQTSHKLSLKLRETKKLNWFDQLIKLSLMQMRRSACGRWTIGTWETGTCHRFGRLSPPRPTMINRPLYLQPPAIFSAFFFQNIYTLFFFIESDFFLKKLIRF